ncbi:hypothetical protein I4905_12905 [Proteus mirabilis]|nr:MULTISPECIES: hypothetical protein [Proteus]EHZ8015331.1 hypothetical protein [Proteus mirabilis]EKV1611582.1 hypothetical protein [Proteus mirabilis]EKV2710468.1 hypothetical protein [Proteus mirabilis]EKV6230898.1 hypothetical protein [Proteus mirabilis]EKV7661316.1 hypothetical protein [Proteus mirabilis]
MLKRLTLFFTLFIIVGCDNTKNEKKEFMHGFAWHQSMTDIKNLNLNNLKCTSAPEGWACSSWSAPNKQLNDYYYFFVVLKDKGLSSLLILELENQSNSQVLLKKYNQLNRTLFDEFGSPTYQVDNIPRNNAFFQCLKNTECGEIKNQYDANGVTAILSILGDDNGGRLNLLMAIDNDENIHSY